MHDARKGPHNTGRGSMWHFRHLCLALFLTYAEIEGLDQWHVMHRLTWAYVDMICKNDRFSALKIEDKIIQ